LSFIYHIASAPDWEKGRQAGEYRISTRGRTLDEQGFIHAGDTDQVAPVANAVYQGDRDLVVLIIDTDRLRSEIRYEDVPGWDHPFPHIYGPLNPDAVVDVVPLERTDDGRFTFTAPKIG
jgi:uncharacterized protein (DUF952 family)